MCVLFCFVSETEFALEKNCIYLLVFTIVHFYIKLMLEIGDLVTDGFFFFSVFLIGTMCLPERDRNHLLGNGHPEISSPLSS